MSSTDLARAQRIAEARAALVKRHAEDPEAVQAFEARKARIEAARRREQQRVAHLVLGQPRPQVAGRKGRGKAKRKPVPLEPGVEEAVQLRERWSHKQGAPETHEAAAATHDGALIQLYRNGTIDAEQLEWAAEIANVHRSIVSGVEVAVASLEARVDQSRSPEGQMVEGFRRIRLHLAYGIWRDALPAPRQLVLDMIVGDAVGYTVAARRHRVHNRKAKRLLLEALARWPGCVDQAHRVSNSEIEAMRSAAE